MCKNSVQRLEMAEFPGKILVLSNCGDIDKVGWVLHQPGPVKGVSTHGRVERNALQGAFQLKPFCDLNCFIWGMEWNNLF